uniref:Transposase n=1 Tax=Romanomermis culicivorax TaxID=13658 RepID=A0A915HSE1_ROMCU
RWSFHFEAADKSDLLADGKPDIVLEPPAAAPFDVCWPCGATKLPGKFLANDSSTDVLQSLVDIKYIHINHKMPYHSHSIQRPHEVDGRLFGIQGCGVHFGFGERSTPLKTPKNGSCTAAAGRRLPDFLAFLTERMERVTGFLPPKLYLIIGQSITDQIHRRVAYYQIGQTAFKALFGLDPFRPCNICPLHAAHKNKIAVFRLPMTP